MSNVLVLDMGSLAGAVPPLVMVPRVGKITIVTCVGFSVVVGEVQSVVNLAERLLITLLLLILANIQAIGQVSAQLVTHITGLGPLTP